MSAQAPSAVILVRATKFTPNPATAADNAFQADVPEGQTEDETSARALLEMDALALTVDHRGDADSTVLAAATTFLTTGLAANWDVQVGVELWLQQDVNAGGGHDRRTGLGDLFVRTKWRFFHNEATGTSVALLPYVKLPTNTDGVGNRAVEGGLIVPWETRLPGDLVMQAMAGVDLAHRADAAGHELLWYASAVVTRPLTARFALYGEAAVESAAAGGQPTGLLGGGVTFSPREAISWDLAVYRGLWVDAPDWHGVLRCNFGF